MPSHVAAANARTSPTWRSERCAPWARYVGGHFIGAPNDLHAWVSLHGKHGWHDFDPTLRRLDAGEHITIAAGRDRSDVSPIEGVGAATLDLSVILEPRA